MTRIEMARWVEERRGALNRRDVGALSRLFADNCMVESPTAGRIVRGVAAVDDIHRAWAAGFPDATFTTDEILVEGDRLVWIARAAGTDTGGFLGLPPTGRRFDLPVVVFSTFEDGLVVSERRIYDFTGLLVQTGILKARPSGPIDCAMHMNPSPSRAAAETAAHREQVIALLARRTKAWASRDAATLVAQYTEDGVMDSHLAGRVQGPSQIGEVYAKWFGAFPDSQISSEDVVVEGARIAEFATMTGTDTGGFLGLPPTRKPFRLPAMWLYTLDGERFALVRPVYDFTGMLVQIGALRAKPG